MIILKNALTELLILGYLFINSNTNKKMTVTTEEFINYKSLFNFYYVAKEADWDERVKLINY